MATWLPLQELRDFVDNQKAADAPWLQDACDNACAKVESLCGPVALTIITNELVEIHGTHEACLNFPVNNTLGVTAITEFRTGIALPLTDWFWDGQLLMRRDKFPAWRDLLVTYQAGYYDATVQTPVVPTWARSMAKHIAQQELRTMGRFRTSGSTDPVGFYVPKVALEIGADYLLLPRTN